MNPNLKQALLHITLLIVTFLTTTLAGVFWIHSKILFTMPISYEEFLDGMAFSVPFLGILAIHEAGHYLTARRNGVKTSLPYFIPFIPIFLGTMGAFIRIKQRIQSRREYFDIGIAGPLAGFVIAIGVLYYGYSHLPTYDYIYDIHPEYVGQGSTLEESIEAVSTDSTTSFKFGKNLTMLFFEKVVADPDRLPPAAEMSHYPWLMAGFWALFFTALNLLPIGQLDGGHILYGLIGLRKHKMVAGTLYVGLLFYSGLGLISPFLPPVELLFNALLYLGFLYVCLFSFTQDKQKRLFVAAAIFAAQFTIKAFYPAVEGFTGWLLFAFLIGRVIGVGHPPVKHDEPLSPARQVLGWIALIVFVICFTPVPISLQ
ncbi:site-2 protease family protein [Roseivirga sp. BDSF3-8]|uniref:site-2 protease family protein n=1 Tax=Roseivirga sp. BDSF3-8 TaxID=3241598 RepID=UPI0035325C19